MIFQRWTRLAFAALAVCALAAVSHAGTVSGTVTNGTTGKAAEGVQVILIQLQGGMQPVANTKTDAQGHYKFDNPLLGAGPMLLRAVYRGVFYHEPATPGTTTINISVYEPTDKASAVAVTAHAIIVQPDGANLTVDEEYNIDNKTQPPLAYYRMDGSFLFTLPQGADLGQVSAGQEAGLPVVQTTIGKSKNEKAIAYAFRPGSSRVGVSYRVPYAGNQANLTFSSPYPADRVAVFAPPSVQITGGNFSPAGQEQGFSVYMRESVAANTPISVGISGTAPPPTDNSGNGAEDDSQNPSVNSHVDSGSETPAASVTTMPARLDSLKWIIVAGFAALFILGLIFILRQTQITASPVGATGSVDNVKANSQPPSQPTQSSAANVDQEVKGNLNELKDSLFRLELRREAGTITEEEYARQRDGVQKTLRDLVKG